MPLLSSGTTGAKPEPIFGGGCTAKGFVGRGYEGRGTPSKLISSILGAGAMGMACAGSGKSWKSGLGSSCAGEEAAVPAYAVQLRT